MEIKWEKKYPNVGTVRKFTAYVHFRLHSWFGTMKSGGVKLVLWAQTGPFSEMTRPRLSVFHMLVIC